MSPEVAVTRLAEIVGARAEFTEDELYASMAEAGVPDSVADRAYKFTQTAWGRVLLDGLGVRFGTDYLCFNGAGEVIESGQLAEQPYFVAAMRLAPQYTRSPGFKRFALMSADVSAVNNALHKGSQPESLAMGPAAYFMEAATPAGMERAVRLLSERAAANKPDGAGATPSASKNPWWRFW